MKTRSMRIAAVTTAALTAVSALAGVAPASAADFKVTADKSQNLNIAGETVNLTIEGLPAAQGVYLRLCAGSLAEVSKARPTNCVGQTATAWVTTDPNALRQGAKALTGPVSLTLPSNFVSGETKIDCTQVSCGIHIRRDHLGGAADFSLDRFIPVSFGSPKPAATIELVDGKIQVTAANYVGAKLTFVVGARKLVRSIAADKYVFSVPAPKGASVKVSVLLRGRVIATSDVKLG
ncbi:MAG: hypothetical protein RL096_290 [Actinomycetota bacterium]|jgi:hypothetical protein